GGGPGGGAGTAGRVGPARHPRPLDRHRLALPRDHPTGAGVRPRHPAAEPARRGHGLHPGVRRRALVGTAAARPERPAVEEPPAVPAGRHGDQRRLPVALVRRPQRRGGLLTRRHPTARHHLQV
ncbi:MAG: Uncharacterized amino acid permease, GabP family, partial [uncultured Nocardioidaceae bacterium]